MAENGAHPDEIHALDAEGKVERLPSRTREQRTPRTKDRSEENHLPTPPPDPWSSSSSGQRVHGQSEMKTQRNLDEEEDIIAYLSDFGTSPFEGQASECPSRNSATSTMPNASIYNDEAFEHLDRLYALTEQILVLRTRSSKYFKRVRDLEKLKVLKNADRKLELASAKDRDLALNYYEEDTGFAESLLDAMLSNCRDPQFQRRNIRSPSSRQRSRSLALSEQSLPRLSSPAGRSDIEKRVLPNNISCNAPKVSKWTRVKAAFKWERACTNDIIEPVDSGVAPSTPTTKYLRIPETGSGNWSGSTLSPSISEVSGPSTPLGRVSSASSSNEGSYDGPRKNQQSYLDRQLLKPKEERKAESTSRRSRSLDGDMIMTVAANDAEHSSEITQGKPLIRITSDSNPMIRSSSIPEKQDTSITPKKQTPTLTITIPKNEEEIRCVSSPESTSPLLCSTQNSGGNSPQYPKFRHDPPREFKRQRSAIEEPTTPIPKMQRQDSKWNKVRRAFLTNSAFSVPPSPVRVVSGQAFLQDGPGTPKAHSCSGSVEDLEKTHVTSSQAETRRDYQLLREKLGAEFHRKLVEWERLKNTSPRNNPRNARDNFGLGSSTQNTREVLLAEERLAPEFKKKLQDWKRAKKGRRGSATIEQNRASRRRLTDWQLWRSPSKPDASNDLLGVNGLGDGRHRLCEDFVRRMEVWRRMNETGTEVPEVSQLSTSKKLGDSSGIDESEFVALEKVLLAFGNTTDRERRCSDVKQLEECFDGDTRLVDGLQNAACNNEILIRTSVGSYRFEGISREFTRKLYDWEKYRGISPRSSTFRLLAPGYSPFSGDSGMETSPTTPTSPKDTDAEKTFLGTLKKSKSVGSVVDASMRNVSFIRRSTSLQSLDRLANKLDDADRVDASPAPGYTGAVNVSDDAIMDDSEPEAMIVDIEDVIEETASPLERVQPHQTPVYSVAASETTSIAVPLGTVTSSHEPSPVFLVEVEDNSSRNHWQSRSWNQCKTFSSDDSPSPEHFKNRKLWKRNDSPKSDSIDAKDFREYEPIEWKEAAQNFSRDKDSMNSEHSASSGEYYDTCRSEILNNGQSINYADGKRDGISTISSDGESTCRRNTEEEQPERKTEAGDGQIPNLRDLDARAGDLRKSMRNRN